MTACRPSVGRLVALAGALACGLVGGAGAADAPAGKVIAAVVPVDLKSVDPEYVKSLMTTRAGRVYDDATVNQDVQKLHNTRLFVPNSVTVSTAVGADGRVTVFVKAQELLGVIKEVVFRGAEHLSDTELYDLTGVRRNGPMNPATNQLARQAIHNKLREDGRYYASVDLVKGGDIRDDTVEFNIVEGPVVRVKGIKFRGNQDASSARLATQTVSGAAWIPGAVTALTAKFNPATIEEDKKKLVTYYHRMGYLDAMVREEVEPVHGGRAVYLVYHIHEGRPYTVRNVQIDGNKTFTEAKMRTVTALASGKVYDIDVVHADEKRLETLVGNGGYFTRVEHEKYAVPGQPGVVDVHYHVAEQDREPARVGRIIIVGNTVTQDRVILNQLGLFPGQILQYPKLDDARNNLYRLNLFDMEDPPTVTVAPGDFDGVYKDVLVKVKETQTGVVALQANINSNAGLNGSLTVNQRNFDILRVPTSLDDLFSGKAFRGGGQELRIEAMPGTVFQRYAVTFREPYLFDSKYGLTVGAYYFSRNYAEYDEQRLGIRTTVDYRFADSPIWRATFATRLEGVTVSHVPSFATAAIRDDAGQSTLLGLRAGLTRDTRDSYLLPTSGSSIDFGVEQVLGDYTFPIGTLEGSKFWTTWQRKDGSGKHVLSARSALTVMADNAPVFERVYAGGIRSFRGFTFRGVGPYENNLNVGGTFAFLNTLEYQIPVMANDKLHFATFIDHGTVERDVAIRDYRVAVGAGLRIAVPALGPLPIALDFAVPLSRAPQDHKQLFSFYLGGGF